MVLITDGITPKMKELSLKRNNIKVWRIYIKLVEVSPI